MAGWKKSNKNELVKLNSYGETDITDAEIQIPVVIPAKRKNARFRATDLAPAYKDDENNCLKIEDGVISKTDTTYQTGDDVIKINTVGNKNIISGENLGGKKYTSGAALQVTENTATRITTFSTEKSTDDKLVGNIPEHQKHQPTYRRYSQTQFSGFSSLFGVINDPWWSETTRDSYTLITRIAGGKIRCYNDQTQEKIYYINGDNSTDALYKFNQYAIHMARVRNIYVDYDFLTKHLHRELYISRTYTDFSANNGKNYGSKFFITENAASPRRLRVIIYSCGHICEGYSTSDNPEICLQDICYSNWANGQNGTNFNYMIRPVESDYHLRDYGYNSVAKTISNDGGAHYFIDAFGVPSMEGRPPFDRVIDITVYDKYYDSNNEPCTVLPDRWVEYDYRWIQNDVGDWIPGLKPESAKEYRYDKQIIQHSNFYNSLDPRYNYWQTANKIKAMYYYNSDLATIALRDPNNTYYGKYSYIMHEGEVHRNIDEIYPVSYDEYFSSFRFMVNGYETTTVNGQDYDTVYLVDMRH